MLNLKSSSKIIMGLALLSTISMIQPVAFADIASFNSVLVLNTTNQTGLNITGGSLVSLALANLAWNGTDQPMGSPGALSNPNTARQIFGLSGARLMMFGPNINLNMLPP